MIEALLWLGFGWLLGIIAGLMPGIHANTISFVLLGVAAGMGQPEKWVYVIVGMNVVQCFVDFVPNVFLGLPDEEGFANLMPGHRFLTKGKGIFAVRLGAIGALVGVPFSLLLFPVFAAFLVQAAEFVKLCLPFALGGVLFSMVWGEEGRGKLIAALVLVLAGGFGLLTLGQGLAEPLFPAITGLFGLPGLLYSAKAGKALPEQHDDPQRLKAKTLLEGGVLGGMAAGLVALLPAIGPGEASFLLMKLFRKMSPSLYLLLTGCINAANLLFSFFFLYLLGKTRSGAAAALAELQTLDEAWMIAIAGASLVSAACGALAAVHLAKIVARKMPEIDYPQLSLATAVFLVGLVAFFQGGRGLLLLGTATSIGLLPLAFKVRRAHAMAYLMVPTLGYYLGVA